MRFDQMSSFSCANSRVLVVGIGVHCVFFSMRRNSDRNISIKKTNGDRENSPPGPNSLGELGDKRGKAGNMRRVEDVRARAGRAGGDWARMGRTVCYATRPAEF